MEFIESSLSIPSDFCAELWPRNVIHRWSTVTKANLLTKKISKGFRSPAY